MFTKRSMCGITFAGNCNAHEKIVLKALEGMKNRGRNNTTIITKESFSIGHNLHAIVGYEPQPFETNEYIFATNCEIYNWKELAEKYAISARNDAHLLAQLFHMKKDSAILQELDGVYAFIYYDIQNKEVSIARDVLGVKPLWYSTENGFFVSSERKVLVKQDIPFVKELNPRQVLTYNFLSKKESLVKRDFFHLEEEHKESYDILKKEVFKRVEDAVLKRVPSVPFGVLFSGGVDSTIICFILKKHSIPFTCYTAAVKNLGDEASDLTYAKKIAKDLDLNLVITTSTLDELEEHTKKVCELIESSNVTKVGVALPFYVALEAAYKDGCKVIFSGLGSEELFAGYERHAVSAGIGSSGYDTLDSYDALSISNVNKECLSGLLQIHERDLYRDDVITMYHTIELRLPFLDKHLISYALNIPPHYKISRGEKKIILREAFLDAGLKEEFARRPKKAAQYGSKFDKALSKLAKKLGFSNKSSFLLSLYSPFNLQLGSLLSTGKDSLYAAYIMKQRNYDISCFMTMKSSNKDSFMFHTPHVDLANLQSKAAGIPLLTQETKGEKELELQDLKTLLSRAKELYAIEGVVTGALFSTYQRDRIESICDELGLVCFNPLWHKNQEEYMYELLQNNFSFILSKVMAEGLDASFVGRVITESDIETLIRLNKKVGLNVAFEGGEAESLVIDCPLFKKKLSIISSSIITDPERKETAELLIKDISLIDK